MWLVSLRSITIFISQFWVSIGFSQIASVPFKDIQTEECPGGFFHVVHNTEQILRFKAEKILFK